MKSNQIKFLIRIFCIFLFFSSCSLINQNLSEQTRDVTIDVTQVISAIQSRQIETIVVNDTESHINDDSFYIVASIKPRGKKHFEKTICNYYINRHGLQDPSGDNPTFYQTFNNPKLTFNKIPYGKVEIKIYLYKRVYSHDDLFFADFDEHKKTLVLESQTSSNSGERSGCKIYTPASYVATATTIVTATNNKINLVLQEPRCVTGYISTSVFGDVPFDFNSIVDDSIIYIPSGDSGCSVWGLEYEPRSGESTTIKFSMDKEVSGKDFLDAYYFLKAKGEGEISFIKNEE